MSDNNPDRPLPFHLNCPHCHNPIEIVAANIDEEILCPSCGSSFRVDPDRTKPISHDKPISFGKFELIEVVGRGAFGTVYRARDTQLQRIVAVKVPRSGQLSTLDEEDRFVREARSAAQLNHSGIVPVHEVGRDGTFPYIVSEFVSGITLSDALTARQFGFREAAQLVARVAEALQHAHSQGVVHRDLKPSNIMLTPDGTPRVMDFGLAKRDAGEITMTIEGQVLGTPAYMSPEQASGQAHHVDGRSDVYSLGSILYELLTGELPFRGNQRMILHQVMHDEPRSLRSLNDRIPQDLETICLKAMSKEPGRRYQSAQAMGDDLTRYLTGQPITARRVGRVERGWRWCRRNPLVAGLSTAVVLALLLGTIVSGYSAIQTERRAAAEQREAEAIAQKTRADAKAAEAEASAQRAASHAEAASATEATQRYYELLNRTREGSGRRRPGWTWKALDELTEATRIPTNSRNLVELRTEVATCLAGVDLREIGALAKDCHPNCLAFSSDGRRMAVGLSQAWTAVSVNVYDVQSRQQLDTFSVPPSVAGLLASQHPDAICSIAFSPDGRWLSVGTRFGAIHAWDTTLRPAKPHSWQAHTSTVASLLASRDGTRLFSASVEEVKSWPVPPDGKPLSSWKADGFSCLSLSPDGQTIACGTSPLTLLNSETLQPTENWTEPAWRYGRVCFSPNGLLIATSLESEGYLRLINAKTGETVRKFIDPYSGFTNPGISSLDFSPAGTLVVTSGYNAGVKLWDATSGTLVCKLPLFGPVEAVFHPQGRLLATTGNNQVLLFEIGGMREQTLVAQQVHPLRAIDVADQTQELACAAEQVDASRGFVTRWDLASGRLLSEWPIEENVTMQSTIALDSKGDFLALSCRDARNHHEPGIFMWRARDPGRPWRQKVPDPTSISFSRDGQKLWGGISGEATLLGRNPPGRIVSWSVPDLNPTSDSANVMPAIFETMGFNSVSAGDQWIVAGGSSDATFNVFNAQRGDLAYTFHSSARVHCVAISPNDDLVVAGTERGALDWVRLSEKKVISIPTAHTDYVTSLAFSGNGRLLASASEDRTIRLWQVQPGALEPLLTLRSTSGPVTSVRFDNVGSQLVYLVLNETAVRVWHLNLLKQRLGQMGLDWQ